MAHNTQEKKKLLNRVRRIRGQVEAIERAMDQEAECSEILHNISACRGAMDSLMAEAVTLKFIPTPLTKEQVAELVRIQK